MKWELVKATLIVFLLIFLALLFLFEEKETITKTTSLSNTEAKTNATIVLNTLKTETVIIEYEIYKEGKYNEPVFEKYLETFIPEEERWWYAGVPHVFINNKTIIVGDEPILENLVKELKKSSCIIFSENFTFNIWQGKPKIWYCDRVLIITKENYKPPEKVLKEFFNPEGNLSKLGEKIEPFPVEYSCRPDVGRCFYGGKVCFKHAVKGDGYIIEWGMYFCHNNTEIKMECKEPKYCLIYFTGIGCPHCALTDPYLFYGILEWNGKKYVFK